MEHFADYIDQVLQKRFHSFAIDPVWRLHRLPSDT